MNFKNIPFTYLLLLFLFIGYCSSSSLPSSSENKTSFELVQNSSSPANVVLDTTTLPPPPPPPPSTSSTTTTEKNPNPADNDVVRVRRQEGGGGSTAVIGTRIKRETTEADWEEAKFGAYAPPPPSSRRGGGGGSRARRSLSLSSLLPSFRFRKFFTFSSPGRHSSPSNDHQLGGEEEWQVMDDDESFFHFDPPPHHHGPPAHEQPEIISEDPAGSVGSGPQQVFPQQTTTPTTTTTAQRFNVINRNFAAAENYQLSSTVQGNPLLRDNIFISPQGVSCLDLCAGPPDPSSTGFAMLGMCTSNYCECSGGSAPPQNDFQNVGQSTSQDRQCPQDGHSDLIFDPVSLTCRPPSATVLCSDLEIQSLFDEHANNHVDGGSFHEVEVQEHHHQLPHAESQGHEGQGQGSWDSSDDISSSSGWRR